MARVKDLRAGSAKSSSFPSPATSPTSMASRSSGSITTSSPLRPVVGRVPHERLKEITERFPHLTRLYWLMTNLDAAIHREWTLSLGRRSAIARMAHLICELNLRLGIAGVTSDNSYEFPLTQVELGECLGLTAVHVNRTLQELSESAWSSSKIAVLRSSTFPPQGSRGIRRRLPVSRQAAALALPFAFAASAARRTRRQLPFILGGEGKRPAIWTPDRAD